MLKLKKVDGQIRDELRKSFSEMKENLDPLLNHLNFGDIDLYWWLKKNLKNQSCAGKCFKGNWMVRVKSESGRKIRRHFHNLIILSTEYFETLGLEETIDTFKHEVLHLIAKDTHGSHFQSLARSCNCQVYCKRRVQE